MIPTKVGGSPRKKPGRPSCSTIRFAISMGCLSSHRIHRGAVKSVTSATIFEVRKEQMQDLVCGFSDEC